MPELVKLAEAIVNGQYRNIRREFLGTGELHLSDNCKQPKRQNNKATKITLKIRKYVDRDNRLISSTDRQIHVIGLNS